MELQGVYHQCGYKLIHLHFATLCILSRLCIVKKRKLSGNTTRTLPTQLKPAEKPNSSILSIY